MKTISLGLQVFAFTIVPHLFRNSGHSMVYAIKYVLPPLLVALVVLSLETFFWYSVTGSDRSHSHLDNTVFFSGLTGIILIPILAAFAHHLGSSVQLQNRRFGSGKS